MLRSKGGNPASMSRRSRRRCSSRRRKSVGNPERTCCSPPHTHRRRRHRSERSHPVDKCCNLPNRCSNRHRMSEHSPERSRTPSRSHCSSRRRNPECSPAGSHRRFRSGRNSHLRTLPDSPAGKSCSPHHIRCHRRHRRRSGDSQVDRCCSLPNRCSTHHRMWEHSLADSRMRFHYRCSIHLRMLPDSPAGTKCTSRSARKSRCRKRPDRLLSGIRCQHFEASPRHPGTHRAGCQRRWYRSNNTLQAAGKWSRRR